MKNLILRTIFGSLYVAVIVACCLFGQPYLLGFVFLTLSMLTTREYTRMVNMNRFTSIGAILLSGLVFLFFWTLTAKGSVDVISKTLGPVSLFGYILLLVILILAEIFRKNENPMQNWGNLLITQFWIAMPFSLMAFLGNVEPMALLSIFVIIWINDTGAYCVGSLIGKHKMIPSVSPGKSWEGLFGGILFAMGAGYIFLADPWNFTHLNMSTGEWIIITLLITIFGTLGDLLESKVKRTLGVKDSGKALPGHGGWLDRFDSVLLATIAVAWFFLVLTH